jgi:hypothetical protein
MRGKTIQISKVEIAYLTQLSLWQRFLNWIRRKKDNRVPTVLVTTTEPVAARSLVLFSNGVKGITCNSGMTVEVVQFNPGAPFEITTCKSFVILSEDFIIPKK